MALPKSHRLRCRYDFNAVYQAGSRHNSPHLSLRALRDSDRLGLTSPAHAAALSNSQPTRIGISISQKVSKRAVDRNRIKRQIRAALQEYLPDLKTGWRIVIVVRPTAIQCDYQQFLQELKQLLIEAEVVNGYSGRSVF